MRKKNIQGKCGVKGLFRAAGRLGAREDPSLGAGTAGGGSDRAVRALQK